MVPTQEGGVSFLKKCYLVAVNYFSGLINGIMSDQNIYFSRSDILQITCQQLYIIPCTVHSIASYYMVVLKTDLK